MDKLSDDEIAWMSRRKRHIEEFPKCYVCKSIEQLEVHHKNYEAQMGFERRRDLKTLCRPCHVKLHKLKRGSKNIKKADLQGLPKLWKLF